jgi:hypothetical protein
VEVDAVAEEADVEAVVDAAEEADVEVDAAEEEADVEEEVEAAEE